MRCKNLTSMPTSELVSLFVDIAIAEDDAILMDDNARYSRLYWQMDAVEKELRSRPGDERGALLDLYKHSNAQVRLMAAKATLAVAPIAARQLLQAIYDSKEYPQAGDAGMSLWNLDRGVFKPT
jgi:hypothetical protein